MLGCAGTQPGPECVQEERAGILLQDCSPKTKIWAEFLQPARSRLYTSSVISAGVHIEVFSLALYIFYASKKNPTF